MKTEYKNITYREDRKIYCIKVRVDGKQVNRSCKSIKEAIEIRDELYVQAGIGLLSSDMKKELNTFKEYYDDFLSEIKDGLKPSTYHKYLLTGKSIAKFVGHESLDSLGEAQWKRIMDHFVTEGYSARYIKDKMRRVSILYNHYEFPDNPVERLLRRRKLSLGKKKEKERRAFSDAEIELFMKAVQKYSLPIRVLFKMYFYTGCRRAELPALTWDNVHIKEGYIVIRNSVNKGVMVDTKEYKEIIGDTKNKKVRIIPITRKLMAELVSLKEYDKFCGDSKSNFVFKPITPYHKYPWLSISSIQRIFADIKNESEIGEDLTIHCIRHTWATNLVAAGIDIKTVQAMGGWSSTRVLMEIYAHAKMENMVKAAEAIERLTLVDNI